MVFKKKYGRRKYSKKSKTSKRRTSRVSPAVRSYVKRALNVASENKIWHQHAEYITISRASGNSFTSINLVPTLSQGTTKSTRVGNEIKIVKASIQGHVYLMPYDATNNPRSAPCLIKMWLVSKKNTHSNVLTTSNDFFDDGAASLGFQGHLLDIDLHVNRDQYNIYAMRTVELGVTYPTGSQTTVGSADNSKMIASFKFPFAKHLKRIIKYEDTTTTATNANLFLVFTAVYADGTSAGTNMARYQSVLRVEYQDN